MSDSKLPERASLEYLRKLAKDRLHELRKADPRAKLATAQLAVAREHGFASWRALKAEIDRRQTNSVDTFFDACAKGDIHALRALLSKEPDLVRARHPDPPFSDVTGLHAAAVRGHTDAVRLLLEHGADPNARDGGDNASALHFAAAQGRLDAARALLDGGADVHGFGDAHQQEVIGWVTAIRPPDEDHSETLNLLIERGARHHIFSAIALGDADLIRKVVKENPNALDRRMSRFEQGQTPLHFAMSRKRYDVLDLLIELGADLEAQDGNGNSALGTAMLHGDREAMSRLHAAGAKPPKPIASSDPRASLVKMAASVKKVVPMIHVPDIAATLTWYTSIGFTELARFGEDDEVSFGMVSFGKAELMLNLHGKKGDHDVSLWFYTDQIDQLYQLLKSRQLEAARAALAGEPGDHAGIEFEEDIYNPFYGGRQFGIRDPNGYILYFLQP